MERTVTIDSNGLSLFGIIHTPETNSPGPAVLMLHGLGGTHIESHLIYTKAARALASRGITALRFDFRGSGNSQGDFMNTTPQGEIDDANAALDFLMSQPEVDRSRIGVLGLSMGGFVAACLAGQRQEVKALVLWSAVANMGELLDSNTDDMRLAQLQSSGYVDLGGIPLSREFIEQAHQIVPEQQIKQYKGPALVIHGSNDETVPVEHAYRFKNALGDQARLMIVDGADHVFSSLEWERAVINETVNWFKTLDTAPVAR